MKHLNFFIESVKLTIASQMVYKFNFISRTITLMTFDLLLPLITILIYLQTDGFPGWTFHEILLFQGVFIFVNSIDRMFFQKIDWGLSYDVRTGNFDRILLFPVNTLTYLVATNFGIEHFADMLIGIAVMTFAILRITTDVTILNTLIFLGYLILAVLFTASLSIIRFAITIRVVKTGRLGELFRIVKGYGEYPVDIYNAFISSVFRYIIPIAVLAYFPATAILGKAQPNFFLIAGIVIGIFAASIVFWKVTLKKYTSAGG